MDRKIIPLNYTAPRKSADVSAAFLIPIPTQCFQPSLAALGCLLIFGVLFLPRAADAYNSMRPWGNIMNFFGVIIFADVAGNSNQPHFSSVSFSDQVFPAEFSPQLKCLPRQLKCVPCCLSTAGPRPFLCVLVFAPPTLPGPSNLRVAGGLLYRRMARRPTQRSVYIRAISTLPIIYFMSLAPFRGFDLAG